MTRIENNITHVGSNFRAQLFTNGFLRIALTDGRLVGSLLKHSATSFFSSYENLGFIGGY